MFRRLILDNWMAVFTLTAFATALSIYLCIAWRALRMRPAQREQLARLPLED
jgi:hypothetical protein